jgi:hypothetical protein
MIHIGKGAQLIGRAPQGAASTWDLSWFPGVARNIHIWF